jgi:hypothetical protein
MGLLFMGLVGQSLLKTVGSYAWKTAPASILSSAVEEDKTRDDPFVVAVKFRYQWEGRELISERYSTATSSYGSYDDAMGKISAFPIGAVTTCFVNPKDPAEAVLRREGLWLAILIVIPLVFVAVGAGGIFSTWFAKAARTSALSAPSGAEKSRGGAIFFGAIFALVGGGLLVFWFLPTLTKSLASSSWRETPCTVISSRVKSHSSSDGTTYSVDVFYRYVFDGREYRSNRYAMFGGSSSGHDTKAAVVALYPQGKQAVCFVNPENPQEAVLKAGVGWWLLFGLIPLVFLAIGGWIMLSAFRGSQAVGLPNSPDLASAPTGEPLVLKPGASPLTKLLACVAVAIFWNGIVSVFLFDLVGGFSRGRPDWGLALFLTPFVLVGLGLVAGIGYNAMALTNPRCRLRLTPAALAPGQGFSVSWELNGAVHRVNRFAIFLEGWEEATYRRGTSSYTDRSVFARFPVVEILSSLEMGQGEARCLLPEGVMPSFTASNNKILWALKVRGEIARWPDLTEEYAVEVLAGEGAKS